ncbi:hypothetical protein BMQ_pBM30003 (plasmid) [Priestia megaterium QM B1551]|uniref:Uncharacterized protein n=1 Tax=Priestia megaterium (strain ATCC 12872 / QMB1551) TaxID=545693 RepID=D5E397_PRIM1|nr:hypothetical protein BMQ_pBM30003 [Priestia megaterium QM B1551]
MVKAKNKRLNLNSKTELKNVFGRFLQTEARDLNWVCNSLIIPFYFLKVLY